MASLIGTNDMASRLGCGVVTLRELARSGVVPHVEVAGKFKFDPDKVMAALEKRTPPGMLAASAAPQ